MMTSQRASRSESSAAEVINRDAGESWGLWNGFIGHVRCRGRGSSCRSGIKSMAGNWVYGGQDMQYATQAILETSTEQTCAISSDGHRIACFRNVG